MTHPEIERLLAHVDGELPHQEANAVAGHIAGCATCARAVADLRETSGVFGATLLAVDRLEPAAWGGAATAVTVISMPASTRGVRPARWGGRILRRAALFLLATGAVASAAVLVDRVVLTDRADSVVVPVTGAAPAPAFTAVAVVPVGGAVEIALAGAGGGTRVQLVLEERSDARVIVEGAASPHFTAVDGRVNVQLGGATVLVRLVVPQGLESVRVSVAGEVVLRIEDGRVTPAAALDEGILIGSDSTRRE